MKSSKQFKDDKQLDHLLNELPLLSVPDSFQARVMESLRKKQELPWWKTPFWDWSRSLQMCSGVLAVLVSLGSLGFATSMLTSGLNTLGAETQGVLNTVTRAFMITSSAGGKIVSNWIGSVEPIHLVVILVPLGVSYLASLFIGTLLFRIARA